MLEERMVSAQGMQQESVSGAWMHSTLVFSSSQAIYGKRCLQKTKLPLALPHPSHSAQASPTGQGRSKICRRMSRPTGHMRAHNFRGPLLRGCVSRTEPPGLAFGLGLTSWGVGGVCAGLRIPQAADTSPVSLTAPPCVRFLSP